MPKLSVCIPIHDMENGDFFLTRLLNSLQEQTFRDFEIVITKRGKMAENTNAAIKQAKGELIKILYMDDYLAHPEALQRIVEAFTGEWLVTGCVHIGLGDEKPHSPHFPDIEGVMINQNSIGSPSVLTIKNDNPLLFNEEMSWLLDVDYYKRMYAIHGEPVLLDDLNVVIGLGTHQTTHVLTNSEKHAEEVYLKNK